MVMGSLSGSVCKEHWFSGICILQHESCRLSLTVLIRLHATASFISASQDKQGDRAAMPAGTGRREKKDCK